MTIMTLVGQKWENIMGRVDTFDLSELTQPDFKKAIKLLNILSKEDTLIIFSLAKNGLKAETTTPSKVELTKKQYYTRLNQLKTSELIEKREGSYYQTTLGSYIWQNCILQALEAVKNSKEMTMIDVLKHTDKFSENDILQIKTALRLKPLQV